MSKKAESGRHFEILAAAVAGGSTIRAAASLCNCSERVAYRIASLPEFKLKVNGIRTEITSGIVGKLASASCQAVSTLQELLDSKNEPKTRLDACKLILSNLGPLTEQCELRQRIDSLEKHDESQSPVG